MSMVWVECLQALQSELPDQQYNTWIRPLQGVEEGASLSLLAPNRFVVDWVKDRYLSRIKELLSQQQFKGEVSLQIGSLIKKNARSSQLSDEKRGPDKQSGFHRGHSISQVASHHRLPDSDRNPADLKQISPDLQGHHQVGGAQLEQVEVEKTPQATDAKVRSVKPSRTSLASTPDPADFKSNLNESFTFDSFVEGKSNQLGRAAALQVAENPGGAYNPLFIYGGVGLGKTHLMHSVGNYLVKHGRTRVVYLHSERFVADMVKALQTNAISDFKRFYRSVDALLIDDIQFFSGKERSQEEFFHTFNALLEGRQQMILTSDRYPKEISGVEERLKSRFGWGLTVAVEPPELETRVAIIKNKAMQTKTPISDETAFFIAQKICSNVRELEGALKRVIANAQFTGKSITLDFVKESLKDLLALQDRQVSIDNIQKTVAEYFKIKTADLLSKRRNRSVARPRQVAMALAKDLTNHSLPEIGQAFGGRDHTTVLHGCRKIAELRQSDREVEQDFIYLTRMLTT